MSRADGEAAERAGERASETRPDRPLSALHRRDGQWEQQRYKHATRPSRPPAPARAHPPPGAPAGALEPRSVHAPCASPRPPPSHSRSSRGTLCGKKRNEERTMGASIISPSSPYAPAPDARAASYCARMACARSISAGGVEEAMKREGREGCVRTGGEGERERKWKRSGRTGGRGRERALDDVDLRRVDRLLTCGTSGRADVSCADSERRVERSERRNVRDAPVNPSSLPSLHSSASTRSLSSPM